MAGEAEAVQGQQAGNAGTDSAQAGNVAAQQTATQKRVEIPAELKPEFDAYAQRAAEAAVRRERKQWESEAAEQKRMADLDETQRAKAEAAKLKAELAEVRMEQQYSRLQMDARTAADRIGFVPPEILRAVLDEQIDATGDRETVDTAEVARLAHERFQGYLGRQAPPAGEAGTQQRGAAMAPQIRNTGGTPAKGAGGPDLSAMTSSQVAEYARSLGPKAGKRWLQDVVNPHLERGGVFQPG